jgi:hypothetical protein
MRNSDSPFSQPCLVVRNGTCPHPVSTSTEGTEGLAGGAVAAAAAVALLPFLGPLLEIYLFSRKSADAIEDTVRIKESLQVPPPATPLSLTALAIHVCLPMLL